MIHEEFRELIILAALNESDDFNNYMLLEHLKNCPDCREEYNRMLSFNSEVTLSRPRMQDRALLEKARRELRQNLANLNNSRTFTDYFRDFFLTNRLTFGGAALFFIGIFTGLFFSSNNQQVQTISANDLLTQNSVKISNISFIDSDPADGEISFAFDAVKPVTMRGKVTDPNIQQILALSLSNEKNDGVRLRTINTIASQTMITSRPGDKIKSALIKTVKYDLNPGVRREALITLNRLPLDQDIIDALLYVLENDTNAGLRIAAINSFDPEKLKSRNIDQEFIDILKQKTREDKNEYIKLRARTVLEEVTTNESL